MYLELIIIIEEIKINSSKINIIVNWLILIKVKDVQSFLDLANFYKRFIYNYSRIVISLTHLIRKDVLFVWSQKCQIAFNTLKKVFTFKIILRHYNSDHKIVIEIDASNYVFKDILFQYDENEILHLVTYFQRSIIQSSVTTRSTIKNSWSLFALSRNDDQSLKTLFILSRWSQITKILSISCQLNSWVVIKLVEVSFCLDSTIASLIISTRLMIS